ncbi:myb/SANT-like DNA-binding domain-containing protein 4 [Drosophila sechellia]|uniref:Regulatory protein zeste n=1 Tax=Drosophila sechellia TaxID=7238 RepID=B4IDA6_DROSE|nr:myb/SANT-like DNA-binding domain-containing protein 4 [Drosophila sechellia]EDW45532.1 GM16825 [Drosophila sechellia]
MLATKRVRARAKNFTIEEEEILENLILAHRDVIRNKQKDPAIWRKKSEAWKQIEADFAIQTGVERSWQALREKYTNNLRLMRKNGTLSDEEAKIDNAPDSGQNLSISGVSSLAAGADNEESSAYFEPEFSRKSPSSDSTEHKIVSSNSSYAVDRPIYSALNANDGSVDVSSEEDAANILKDEKVALIRLQQEFYRCENARAAEKHKLEMEKQKYELEQRKVELRNMRLKNELLEAEILEKRRKVGPSNASS